RRREPSKSQPSHFGRLGDPEVDDPERAIAANHNVLRLKIAMHNLVFMHMSKRITNVAGNPDGLGQEPGTRLSQQRAERFTLKELRNNILAALSRDFDKFQDVWVI